MSKARKIGSFGKSTNNCYKAVIYCRVSSDRQKTEGHGLDSQEHRCQVYAQEKGYEVVRVFKDSFTGGGDYMRRPALSEMLDFVSNNAHSEFVIIFDDLKRLARDTVSHWQLRQHISKLGATVESPNFEFKEDDDSSWMHEAINAVFNENERRTNRRQVIQKQKARLESGYWAFGAKRGYKMLKDPLHGKLLTAFEPDASILREAIEGFANGRFLHKVNACEFLVEKGFWTKQQPERYIDKFTLILQDCLYAGYIEYPMWEVSMRKGHHKGIITLDVFEAVKRRLNQDEKGKRVRIDVSETFPLRGLLVCDACEKPLTGAVSSGRSAKYPYYRCQNKECEFGCVSIKADDVHTGFEKIIGPTPQFETPT
jgi:site-specific DNA recombinase